MNTSQRSADEIEDSSDDDLLAYMDAAFGTRSAHVPLTIGGRKSMATSTVATSTGFVILAFALALIGGAAQVASQTVSQN
jgi:hypothetical protein